MEPDTLLSGGVAGGVAVALAIGYKVLQVLRQDKREANREGQSDAFVNRLMARIETLEKQLADAQNSMAPLLERVIRAESVAKEIQDQLDLYEHTWQTQEAALAGYQHRNVALEIEVKNLKTMVDILEGK
jgi:hypothetical protein